MLLIYPKEKDYIYPVTIIHVVEPFASGVAVFVKLLTEAMPDDLHIIVHGERRKVKRASEVKKEFLAPNVRFIKWRSAQRSIDPVRDVMALSELVTIFRRLRRKGLVDAVHLHSSKSGLLGRAAARIAGINNVFYTPNGASFLSSRLGFVRYFFKVTEKWASRLGGRVVCCSPSEFLAYRQLGIDARYINNGISSEFFKSFSPASTRQGFTIVTSGRIDDQKNPALFNEIAAYFSEIPEVNFVWIGDGKLRNELRSPNIRVTGWLNATEAHDIVKSAQVYLSTSRYEGLSFAVLEALAMRKPVLLSNCTGNVDLVRTGVNGDLFSSSYEAIVKLLQYYNNPEMLQVMGDYSAEICESDYDMQTNFKNYRHLYAGNWTEISWSTLSWLQPVLKEKIRPSTA